ncbi:MAG: 23S rRNA (uracil(1939)-C(5))-methyltransferase RlmD, partial [Lachnospiraceae bacterium]|nr:23S rRNA (uracil(1939)-C(5))-methyltransferase RlmD [Lachnospiraceae bacterium]
MKQYSKDDILTVRITDMDDAGCGIGKDEDGFTLFVKDAVVGDTVKVKIMKAKKNFAFARLSEVIEPSPERVIPPCPNARACGGCQLQALDYAAQLRFKAGKVRNNLMRIGGFDEEFLDAVFEEPIGMEEPFGYRNKAQYPVGRDRKTGEIIAGFYAGRTHDIVPCLSCMLGPSEYEGILRAIIGYMNAKAIEPYSETTGKGLVRHILIRKGFRTGEIMVCLIVNTKSSDKRVVSVFDGLGEVLGIHSLSLNFNDRNTNVIMGDETVCIFGSPVIHDSINGVMFEISPRSFYQVNPIQVERLYGKAVEYAALSGDETVWDLYCGIGTISLSMAGSASKVYGVEVVPEAIEDARKNAVANGISNAEFMVGKAEEVLPEFYRDKAADGMCHPDVIVVDPPRKGCDEVCLDTMLRMSPSRIVYVSCDSATLARDLKILSDGGYRIEKVCPVDMFPQTVHVETVCLLVLRNDVTHINID